jgi:hypothetical protein
MLKTCRIFLITIKGKGIGDGVDFTLIVDYNTHAGRF